MLLRSMEKTVSWIDDRERLATQTKHNVVVDLETVCRVYGTAMHLLMIWLENNWLRALRSRAEVFSRTHTVSCYHEDGIQRLTCSVFALRSSPDWMANLGRIFQGGLQQSHVLL